MSIVKSTCIAFLIHIIMFTFIWVGFAVPKSRGKVEFNYLGSLFPMEEYNQKDETNQILKLDICTTSKKLTPSKAITITSSVVKLRWVST